MKLPFLLCLLLSLSLLSLAQDSGNSLTEDVIIEDRPISLEAEEEALILERHKQRQKKAKSEIIEELSFLKASQLEINENLYQLQNEFQRSSSEQSLISNEINQLNKKRSELLKEIGFLLSDEDIEEDWDKAPVKDSQKLQRLNEALRILDTKIAAKELAIPQQIEVLEELEDQIEANLDFSEQLQILEENNEVILRKIE